MSNTELISQSVDRPKPLSIHHLLEIQNDRRPDAVAIAGLVGASFSFRRLLVQAEQAAKTLNALGIGRNDRVAMVSPNGTEMALAFLAVSSAATFAPLNPACRTSEFEFYLTDLNAKALIVQSLADSPAIAVARKRCIAIIELSSAAESDTGIFSTGNEKRPSLSQGGFAQADDVALILHTSGTTARPKMVPLTHANLLASAGNIAANLQLTETDRCLNVMPLFHIHGLVGAVLSSIVAGSAVICTTGFDLERFFPWLEEFRPTWYTAVPTMHQAILNRTIANRRIMTGCPLRLIRSSSAPLPLTVTAELEDFFKVPVIEAYGMTEASHQIASNPLPPRRRKAGSVGVATGSETAIVDEQGKFLPAGRQGEIVICGANITGGYANNPEANQEAFTNGWFRTGDQGYLDEDGYLFITGRLKEIINRGGEKISPQEVDDVLIDHPAVAQVVTFAVPHPTLGEDIAAAIVLEKTAAVTEIQLQQFVGARLAEFKIPQRVLFVDEIPKSATGKVRRFDLAEKLGLGPLHSPGQELIAPRSELEQIVAKIWSQVLGLEHVSIQENFFQLGGDSIRAGQIIARVRQALQVDLSISSFFETPTIAALAKCIERVRLAAQELETQPLLPIARNENPPLSFAQQRLWFFDQFEPGNPIYNRPVVLRLTGRLHGHVVERCLNEIVARHEVLRTNFSAAGGEPVQVINPALPLKLRVTDLSDLTDSRREGEALRQAIEESREPFDLTREGLVRATLFRLSEQEHLLLWLTHHILFDGWSDGILLEEFTTLYADWVAGRSPSLPQLTLQYADYTLWQRGRFEDQARAQDLSYWKRQIDNAPQALNLATDHPRPPRQTYRGARQTFSLPVLLSDQLKELSRGTEVTHFMTLFAAFNTLLYRYTGQQDLLVGVPVAGRNRVETEKLIGVFINTLALRTELTGNLTFLELLRRVRDVALQAYQHQELPFERLVEALRPDRDLSRAPLFQVMFQLRNLPQWNAKIPGLRVEPIKLDIGVARFDLTLEVDEMQDGLECTFEYSTDLFNPTTIERMQGHFQTLLEGVTANPEQRLSDLPLMTHSERHRLLVEWNDTDKDYPSDKRVHELFEEQVERTPDSVAVVFEDQALTYRELNQRANQLAHYLIGLGVGPEALVGICLERSIKMVVAVLGVLKSGGAYVPLDPSYPRERLRFMLEDAQAAVVLTQDRLAESFSRLSARVICPDRYREEIALQSEKNPQAEATADNLAYVIFTSGSTGKPKGVQVQHRTAINVLSDVRERLGLNNQDISLFVASLSFDISVMELFLPLSVGARIVVVSGEVAADGPRLIDQLSKSRATVMHATPATWRLLIQAGWQGRIAMILCGGEALQPDLAAQLVTRGTSVWNLYGPTETTIYSSAALCQSEFCGGKVSIGRPIANTRIYLLDGDLRPVPIGVAGELYIGGAGVARGYLNRPEMTAEKFIPDPYSVEPGARLYRTGDLACYLPDGNIDYLGRIDHQVKIRGFRIELGEIESVLSQHPLVLENVVMAREDTSGDNRLVAYVITRNQASVTISALRDLLKGKLPDYMMPSQFVFLDSLPLTPNGKLDRKALPQPDQTRPELMVPFDAPRAPVEELLAEIWAEVLNLQRVGIHDNFFELGGHSLLATQVVSRVRQAFQIELPLRSLFEIPTVAALAERIEETRRGKIGLQILPILPADGVVQLSRAPQGWSRHRMNVIGISGLDNSVRFKKREFPALSPQQYRIAQGFDSAAVLVTSHGIQAAAAEERFTREKATGSFPINAIEYCLEAGRLVPDAVDYVAHGFSYDPFRSFYDGDEFIKKQFAEVYSREAQVRCIQKYLPSYDWSGKLVQVPHHLAHAASAFYLSGFKDSLILVADGMGEMHSTTVAVGRENEIRMIKQMPGLHSLGILYGVFTLYLGFYMGLDEYKVMGLAPYGNAGRYFNRLMELVHLKSDGTYQIPILFQNRTLEEKETYAGTLRSLAGMFGPPREPETEITSNHMDIAAALQATLQTSLMHVLRHFKKETGQTNLCMAGGVALNCSVNGVIKRSRMFKGMFVQPASGDDGTALGAALYVQRQHQPNVCLSKMGLPLWGPEYNDEAISAVLRAREDCNSVLFDSFDDLAGHIARCLAEGQIVGWFQGRMEFGPRALGSRSILADPRNAEMRGRINQLVKKREEFRPFAPAVTAEAAAQFFELREGEESTHAYMLLVAPVRTAYRNQLPAVTHVDGSARVQTVAKEDHPGFWSLLNEFGKISGMPILLNTSFNVRGQPIVRTPTEAIDTFLAAQIDMLVIGNYVVLPLSR